MSYEKFSVLMSVYYGTDAEQFKEAVNSVIKQTLIPDEIVIVVDGQINDDVRNAMNSLQKVCQIKIVIVELNDNVGLGTALKKGTEYISTNWIARMDSDDISMPNRFELQMDAISNSPQLAVVGGQLLEFSGDIHNIIGKRKVPLGQDEIINFAKFRSPFNHPTVVINKSKLKDVGGYENLEGFEDYYLWGKMISRNMQMCNLSVDVLFMRVDDGLYGRRGGRKYFSQYRLLRKKLYHLRTINIFQLVVGNILMYLNAIVPTSIRTLIYQIILHR